MKHFSALQSSANVHAGIAWSRHFGSANRVLASDFRFYYFASVFVIDPKVERSCDVLSSAE